MENRKRINIKKTISNLYEVFKLLLKLKKRYLLFAIILSTLITFIPFVTLLLSQALLNGLQNENTKLNVLILILGIYIGFQLVGIFLNIMNTYFLGKYNEYVSCELSKYFDMLCSNLSIRDFETATTYDMIQRAEYEMGMRPVNVLNNMISLINGLIGISFTIVILIRWHLWIIIGFMFLPIACFNYFKKVSDMEYNTMYDRTSIQRKSWYLTYLLTKDYYIKEVRTLGLTKYLLNDKFRIRNLIYNQNVSILKRKSKFKILYQVLNFVFLFVIVLTALVEAFSKIIMIGNFTTYVTTSTKVENYINVITDSLFNLYTDSLYCENIVCFIKHVDKNNQIKQQNNLILEEKIRTIKLKNVSYKYLNSNHLVLQNINMEINCDDIVAFVGENGSGKTTLIKLILGLYDDYEGEILINGKELRKIDKNNYLKHISTIFQDYNNYEFTIKENILFGDVENNDSYKNMEEVAKITNADVFIKKLPNNYNQQVGNWFSGGVQLSGGQWQKLALSRGIIKNSDMYVFDEPTSSLDPSSEYYFFKNMLEVFKNKVGVFVTHRFINAKVANKIFVFKNGKIIEEGNHEKLINNKKYYYDMYKLQHDGIKNKK